MRLKIPGPSFKIVGFILFGYLLLSSSGCADHIEKPIAALVGTHSYKADSLYQLGDSLYDIGSYTDAITLYQKSADLYKISLDSSRSSDALNSVGLCFKYTGEYDSAIYYIQLALSIDVRILDSVRLGGRLRNIGNVERKKGYHLAAIRTYLSALEIAMALNHKRSISDLHNSLGNTYHDQKRYNLAMEHFNKALQEYTRQRDTLRMGFAMNNIGNVYNGMGLLDSALVCYGLAKRYKEKSNKEALPSTYRNIGMVLSKMNYLDSAHFYLIQAYEKRHETGDEREKSFTANELALLYLRWGMPDSALHYLDLAEIYAFNQNNRTILMDNIEIRARYLRQVGHHAEAYTYLERWAAMRDSVFNEERLKVLELQSAFDLEQKEKERLQVEREREVQEVNARTNFMVAAVFGVSLLLAFGFLVIVYRQRRKLHLLNDELGQKNAKIHTLNTQTLHFTKNSLAEVVSLLNVQSASQGSEAVKDSLTAGKLRMETVNLLYHRLFSTSLTSREDNAVELGPFLEEIVNNTFDALLGDPDVVEKHVDAEEVDLPQERALSLGLIVNEVCINACKYAFSNRNSGTFSLKLRQTETHVELSISDSGPGFPADFDWKVADSFGLQLIRLLTEDLKAELDIKSGKTGLCYYFRLPNHDQ